MCSSDLALLGTLAGLEVRVAAPRGHQLEDGTGARLFDDPAAAADHEGDADARRGNLLIVYDGKAPQGETGLVDQCLRKVGA